MKSADPIRNRRLRRLQLSLEVDDFAGELILDLLDEMERMRRELERLRSFMELEPRRPESVKAVKARERMGRRR